MRAFFNDRLYFKFSPEGFTPLSAEKVEQAIARREAEARQERLIEQGATWLQKVLKGQSASPPANAEEIVAILSAYYLFEKESSRRDMAREILKRAGHGSESVIFTFMVKIGRWHPHENLDLLRHDIRADYTAAATEQARTLCETPPVMEGRRDLRHLTAITIDGPGTLDFDDALSVAVTPEYIEVGIHIADTAHLIHRDDPLDREAQSRVSSIYLPERKIPMLPPSLSEGVCSLRAGQPRPAISTLVKMTPQGVEIDFEIVPSIIEVNRQITYPEADDLIQSDETLGQLLQIAQNYRQRRLDNGAMMIELPEIVIGFDDKGEPRIERLERESPSRMLVSELMILANELAARFLSQKGLPAIFRSQAAPRERLYERDKGSLFQCWMQRKQINRFLLGSRPEHHAGLGLPAYVTATSPIRKYSDLVTQRQLRAARGVEAGYSEKEMELLIATLGESIGQVGRIQARRHRYWLLRYLETQTGRKEQAFYLGRYRRVHNILLPAFMLECPLTGADNITLKPGDTFQTTIQHAHARNDVLTVCWG
jgi:exoribonuclease-2